MLSALRSILQRWVGMTTEVQTLEAEEAPAVPGTTPACSAADFATSSATRRLKRPGALSNEPADLKRPRTAPATPIDSGANGANPPAGKVSDPDSRLGGPADNYCCAARPSATASAPAALNRALRSQTSVSTSPPSATPGSYSSSGAFAPSASRHCVAISGVVTAPVQQQQQQQQQTPRPASEEGLVSPMGHEQPHQPQEQQEPSTSAVPLQLLPALQRAAGAGTVVPGPAAGAGPGGGVGGSGELSAPWGGAAGIRQQHSSHHTHHHMHSHNSGSYGGDGSPPQVLQLQPHPHHHHDALEEQVFSPAFHLPASASLPSSAQASPSSSPQPAAGKAQHSLIPTNELLAVCTASTAGANESALAATTVMAAAAVAAATMAPVGYPHPPPGVMSGSNCCMALHAIDLNVVEGVAVDTDDDELEARGPEAGTVAWEGTAAVPLVEAAVQQSGPGSLWAVETGTAKPHTLAGGAVRPQLQLQQAGGGEVEAAAAADRSVSPSAEATADGGDSGDAGEGIEAVGEQLSSACSQEMEEGRQAGDELDLDECDENNENAPVGAGAVLAAGLAAAARVAVAAAAVRLPQQQTEQQRDAVLVASAPRGLAAAVSAAAEPSQPQLAEQDGEEEEDEDEALLEFDPLMFIKQLPPLESCVPPHRPVLLPLQTRAMARRKTLVLDLDETLVHSSLEAVDRSDFSFPVVFNGTAHQVYVRQRPHLHNFMVRVAALFEVVVFTASQRIYAERLLDILDPQQQLVRHRIYRDSCVVVDGNYLKDLSILGRELAHTVIVDNSPQAFGFQVDNGIPIESWYDDDGDVELMRLLPFLESLAGPDVEDVRPRIRSQFRLRELIDGA